MHFQLFSFGFILFIALSAIVAPVLSQDGSAKSPGQPAVRTLEYRYRPTLF